jgi:PAS domain S-box-containing protein
MSENSHDSQAGQGHSPGSNAPLDSAELRRRAEQKVKAQELEDIASLSPEEARRILYELYVHQVELETQNEELRRMRAELEASRARYFDLYDLAPVGYFTVSEEGLILEANLPAASQLGVARRALAQQPLSHFIFREDEDIYYFHRKHLLETGRPQACELRMKRNDGGLLWARLESAVAQDEDGTHVCRVVMSVITERKQAEEALRESEARFRAIFENAAIGIALVDMRGNLVESNPALQKMLGYNKTELAQMAFSQFTHPDDAKASRDLFAELCEGKRDRYQLEKRSYRKDGQLVWAELTESLVRKQNGEPQYAIGMVEDITERKRAAEALRQLSGRLLLSQDEERRRIARELHDTTAQSLAGLAMNLSVVRDSTPHLSPRARTCLSESLKLAEECSREIRTLAYLLHPPLLEEVGLGSALQWFVDGYTQRTAIDVDLEIPPQLGRLPGDVELALYRVVQEGLTNIHLHSGSKKAQVCLQCRPDQVLLTVADEGRGLPPGVLERGGWRGAKLGVGISGMRERIRQLGGEFEIISGSNGTTLNVKVPLGKDRA